MDKAVKIFMLNDCDWWAGYDLESVKAAYAKDVDDDPSSTENAFELTDEQMESYKFYDDDEGVTTLFKDQLNKMVESGIEFPAFFASTEY